MKPIILILFIAFNVFNFINIIAVYQHDELIALLSTRIIIMAFSLILSVLFIIVGSNKLTKVLSGLTILSALLHFLAIVITYI